MRHGILYYQSLDSLWMAQGHAKTDWTAVVLHKKRITPQFEHFGEMIHDHGESIECVREFLRIRPIAVSEAGIVGGHEMKAIVNPGE